MEKDLVRYITENLVNHPEEIQIRSRRTRNSTVIQLSVAKSDMGRVIGRQGRVANAIRTLLKVAGQKSDTKIVLDID